MVQGVAFRVLDRWVPGGCLGDLGFGLQRLWVERYVCLFFEVWEERERLVLGFKGSKWGGKRGGVQEKRQRGA